MKKTKTTPTMTRDALLALTAADIVSVYAGRIGCCCGCRGKHTYSTTHRTLGATRRGYAVDAAEVNDRVVARHLTRLQSVVSARLAEPMLGQGYVAIELDGRTLVAYLA